MYNLSQIAKILGCPLKGNHMATANTQPQVSLLLTDSRSLTFADQTLFFAIKTQKGDGHKYVSQLYQQGVRAFVVSKSNEEFRNTCPEAWFLVVKDVMAALQKLSAHHRTQFTDIPTSIYWSVVTLTTVGYGDITPTTELGRFISAFTMLLGYTIIAVPTGIVTASMVQASHDAASRVCPNCGRAGHEIEATHCKYCGSALEPPLPDNDDRIPPDSVRD